MTNFNRATEIKLSHKMRLLFVGLAFLYGLMYDLLAYNQHIGLGFVILVNLSVLMFIAACVVTKQLKQPLALLLIIPIFLLSLSTLLYTNFLVVNFVPLFLFVLIIIFFLLLTLRNKDKVKFSFCAIPVLKHIDLPFSNWGKIYRDLFRRTENKKGNYKKVALGIVIASPILLIFAILFANADKIFADMVSNITFNIPVTVPWRIFRTLGITLLASGLFYVLISPAHNLREIREIISKADKVIAGTVLSLLNVLFLSFVFIQIKYLFGNSNYVFVNNISYAEYARSGFFELAWVLGLVALILLVVYRLFCKKNFSKFVATTQVLLVIQTGIIAVSALKRMNLYQDMFGFTVKRLYVEWFIYFALLILLIAAVSIAVNWSFRKFLYSSIVLGLISITGVALLDVDRMIAKENVDRYLKGKELDMNYLFFLSHSAIPEVKRAFDSGFTLDVTQEPVLDEKDRKFNYSKKFDKTNFADLYLKDNTKYSVEQITYFPYTAKIKKKYGWREYNLSRIKSRKILTK